MKKILIFLMVILGNFCFSEEVNVIGAKIMSPWEIEHKKYSEVSEIYSKKREELEKYIKIGNKEKIKKLANNLANYYVRNSDVLGLGDFYFQDYYELAIENGSEIAKKNLEITNKFSYLCGKMVLDCGISVIGFYQNSFTIRGFGKNSKIVSEHEVSALKMGVKRELNVFLKSAELELVGHSDVTEKDGEKLSLERAKFVELLLKELGLNKNIKIVNTVGKGAVQPVDTNETEEGKYLNRRVVGILKNIEVELPDVEKLKNQLEDEE